MKTIKDLIDNADWRRENLDIIRDYEMLSADEFLEKWGAKA
jgi:hypothetical protein